MDSPSRLTYSWLSRALLLVLSLSTSLAVAAPSSAIEPLPPEAGISTLSTPTTDATPTTVTSATVSASTTVLAPLIVIDPGHGGRYSNANANGLREKTVNLYIARALRDALRARGYRVMMTRNTDRAITYADIATWNWSSRTDSWSFRRDYDWYYSPSIPEDDLQGRVNIANNAGADLFISVHANGAYSRRARGYETWAASRDALGLVARSRVQREVISRTGLRDRGAQRADFYVMRWSNMPAFLIESAFITNPSDAYLLKQSSFRKKLAGAVAAAVDAWMQTEPYRGVYPRIKASSDVEFAANVARRTDTTGSAAVLIRQDRWADVPSVAAYASSIGAPLLFTTESGPDTSTAEVLAQLAPSRVVLVGLADHFSPSAVSETASEAGLALEDVEAITAADRAQLSVALASRMAVGPSGKVVVADSEDTTSALAAAAAASALRTPLLLAQDGMLPMSAEAYLDGQGAAVRQMVLAGGTGILPDFAAAGRPFKRYYGVSVLSLGTALNNNAIPAVSYSRPIVADPSNPPAYLVSATRAGRLGQTVVPLTGKVLPSYTRLWMTNRRLSISGFEIHDPTSSVPNLVDVMLRKADYY